MIRTATRTRPCQREVRNGDRAIVRAEGGRTLIVVVDALGHGPVAADVSDVAEERLGQISLARGVADVLAEAHGALRGTRGAALTAVLVGEDAIEAAGVGNVGIRGHGVGLSMVPIPGIVGVRMRSPRVFRAERPAAGRLVVHSDGVSSRFDLASLESLDVEAAADVIFEHHAHDHDDATLVIVDLQRG
jgi:phosphoserine phosphatase RsbX